MTEQTVMSATLHDFLNSEVPKYGGEKPFTLSHGGMDFEASAWWDIDEHMTVGVVLTDVRYLLVAIMAMHGYIVEQWDEAVHEFRNQKPHTPASEYTDSQGVTQIMRESYSADVLQGFGYFMALIVPETVAEKLKPYQLVYDLEVYIVRTDGIVLVRLPKDTA